MSIDGYEPIGVSEIDWQARAEKAERRCAELQSGAQATKIHDQQLELTRLNQKCAELAAALKRMGIGGNHLASALVNKLGAGDDTFPPYTTTYEEARKAIKDPNDADLWVCWQIMMQIRDDLEQKTSAILAQHDAEVERRMLERVAKCIEAEEELPGDPPAETAAWFADEEKAVLCLRAVVRATKCGIQTKVEHEFTPKGETDAKRD